jgi:hypothetical protein
VSTSDPRPSRWFAWYLTKLLGNLAQEMGAGCACVEADFIVLVRDVLIGVIRPCLQLCVCCVSIVRLMSVTVGRNKSEWEVGETWF